MAEDKKEGQKKQLSIVKEALEDNEKIERDRKEESLKNSVKDSAAVNATAGFGDNYLSAYAVAMNATNSQVAMLTSVPNLIAPLSQLFTPKLMEKVSRKKIFSISILIQSLLWIPMILVSLFFIGGIKYAPLFIVIFFTLYAITGNFAAPAMASWLGDLIDKKNAGKFFGFRNKIGGITALSSMLIGGLTLSFFEKKVALITGKTWTVFIGFSLIFFLAMIFRLISRYYVLKQYEPEFKIQQGYYFNFLDFIKKSYKNNYGKFVLFVALMVFATNIAGPLTTVYVLRKLNFSYLQYTFFLVAAAVFTFMFMPVWGRFSDKYGNVKMIKITSFMVPLIILFWGIPYFTWGEAAHPALTFYFYILIQFFSGFAWAGFNLAAGNFVYDAVTPARRSLCVAYSSILNGIGVFIGATLGGLMATALPIKFMDKIMFVLLLSGIIRLIIAFIFNNKIKEVKSVEKYKPLLKIHFPIQPYIGIMQLIFPIRGIKKIFSKKQKGIKK